MDAIRISFDRGTLRVHGPPSLADELPSVVWDRRTSCLRAPAHRYQSLLGRARTLGLEIEDQVLGRSEPVPGTWSPPPLRTYQEDAVAAWRGFGERGMVVLPTGAGKTRVAVAAMAACRSTCVVLCPTRALLCDWRRELARWYDGPIGVVGDGERSVEALTVMTFESAYRHLDVLGARFEMVVADEAHHFGGGLRSEALEMCPAPRRLGLTATAPAPGSAADERLTEILGPVVCEIGLGELLGKHLASLDIVRLGVRLQPGERDEYARCENPYASLREVFRRANPDADWQSFTRQMSRSRAGREALAGHARAVSIASFPKAKRSLTAVLLERHREDKSLVFTSSVEDALTIARDNLIPVISAETGREERDDILGRFREGRLRAIVSARVLNEGIDVPDARVAIVVAGALGEREHVQRIGRVLRPGPGKRALAYELVTRGTLDDARAARRWRPHAAAATASA